MIKNLMVVGIDWDTDGKNVKLPDQMVVKINVEDPTDLDEVCDAIGEALSDATGWCHNGWIRHYDVAGVWKKLKKVVDTEQTWVKLVG